MSRFDKVSFGPDKWRPELHAVTIDIGMHGTVLAGDREDMEALRDGLTEYLAGLGKADEGSAEDSTRECDYCADEVATLSSDGLCDACVALTPCAECDHRFTAGELYKGMCPDCVYNARRSGWDG